VGVNAITDGVKHVGCAQNEQWPDGVMLVGQGVYHVQEALGQEVAWAELAPSPQQSVLNEVVAAAESYPQSRVSLADRCLGHYFQNQG